MSLKIEYLTVHGQNWGRQIFTRRQAVNSVAYRIAAGI